MGGSFTGKNSFSLIKTNPKLTGNIKLIVDSSDNLFLESIDADKTLSLNKYKAVKTDERSKYSTDVYEFFDNGQTPSSLVYKVEKTTDYYDISNNYFTQYYTTYTAGTYKKISKEYKEQIACFAPLWVEKNDIPEVFVVFKLPDPVSVNTKDITSPFDAEIEKKIYDTDYLEDNSSNYFFETILKKSKILKVFDITEESSIGKYIRNHVNDNNFPEAPLSVRYNKDERTTYNGISLNKGGFASVNSNMFSDFFVTDKTITEFDNYVTNGFSRNNVICANILNLEFLFDDEEDEDYSVSRYYGMYCNRETLHEFYLSGEDFFTKKYDNYLQNKDIVELDSVNIYDESNILLNNKDGIKLFINSLSDYSLLSSDIKNQNYYPFILSTDNKYYDIETTKDWNENELILKNTEISTRDFKGYSSDPVGVIPAEIAGRSGRSYTEIKINGTLNDLEIRIKNINEYSTQNNLVSIISDSSLPAGTFLSNKFSSSGTIANTADALTQCINNISTNDESFGIIATVHGEKVILSSRITNDYANTYKILIYNNSNTVPPVSINFEENPTFITVEEYNNKFRSPSNQFKGYNEIGSSLFADLDNYIIEFNMVGGKNSQNSRIKVSNEYFSFFKSQLFLKTINWYSKIKGVYRYLDEPVIEDGITVDYKDAFDYIIVDIESNENLYISSGSFCYLYELAKNKVSLFSIYPYKQFDVDQFRSDYGNPVDGYIDKLENFANSKGNNVLPEEITNEISSFKESGFSTLVGSIDEETNIYPKISNEYDRLNENELPQLALPSRMTPFINKWVLDDDGKDTRENSYRLNTSLSFGFSSFAPSEYHQTDDPNYLTHEWYYLGKYPPYLTDEEKIYTYSYFEDFISKEDLSTMSENKFDDYFTPNRVSINTYMPRKIKYSLLSNGNNTTYSSTIFRGAKILIKKRTETNVSLNFNIKNIVTSPTDEYNGYKFSAVLNTNTNSPLSYNVIENKKYKTITFFIEANLDDFYLTNESTFDPVTGEGRFIDRSALYLMQSKYNQNAEIADTFLSGAFSPFDADLNPTWTVSPIDLTYEIPAFKNTSDGSSPILDQQILPNEQGAYNAILINTPRGIIKIDGIISVSKDSIRANTFSHSTNGVVFSPINSTFFNLYPTFEQSVASIPVYEDGGFNAYTGVIQGLSFGSIVDKVNNGDPSVNYLSYDEDENGNLIETQNEFLLEFVKGDINAKASYLKPEPFISNAIKSNDFKPIGSKLSNLNKTYINPISRIKGEFTPKVKDILLFNDNHENRFNEEIRKYLRNRNVQFFYNFPGFALYNQLYIQKVNVDNPLTVIELTQQTQVKPEWWKVSEIAIDKKDQYIFRSTWDHNYYRKYINSSQFISYPGYVEPKEIPSMLGSSLMNIPDTKIIEKFDSINSDDITRGSTPATECIYKVFVEPSTNKIYKYTGVVKVQEKAINTISPDIEYLYNDFVNSRYNYQDLENTIDDRKRYIINNILTRYDEYEITTYAKFSSPVDIVPVIENKYTEQELIQNGFVILKGIETQKISSNNFDFEFSYTLPRDKNVTLAFIVKLKSV